MDITLNPTDGAGGFQVMVSATLRSRTHTAANRHHAQQLAWRWMREKWPRLAYGNVELEAGSLERSHAGAHLSVSGTPDAGSWVAEVTAVARDSRPWRTRVEVVAGQGDDVLMVQAACAQDVAARAKVAPPKLLAAWTEGLELHDANQPVFGEPRWVADEAQADALLEHLLAAERALPVITLASKGESRYFGVDPLALATALQGMAHVACVTPEARAALSRRLGARLAPVPAAARIHAPGLRGDDAAENHPLVRQPRPGEAPGQRAAPESFRLAIIRAACAAGARAAPVTQGPGAGARP